MKSIKEMAAEVRTEKNLYLGASSLEHYFADVVEPLLKAVESAEEVKGVMGTNGHCVCLDTWPQCDAKKNRLCRPMTFLMFPDPQPSLREAVAAHLHALKVANIDRSMTAQDLKAAYDRETTTTNHHDPDTTTHTGGSDV